MRSRFFATLGLLALLTAASAFGQPRADIPFEFHVGTTVMPAGQYYVNLSADNTPDLLGLACYGCKGDVLVIGYKVGSDDALNQARLVFNKYGNTYFLSTVWPSEGAGMVLPISKTEHEIRHKVGLAQTSEIVLARR